MNAISPSLRRLAEQSQKLVVWVYRDSDSQWAVRREGDLTERHFACRADAVEFARCLADASSGYKLFLQLVSGRFLTEYRNYF